MKRVITLFLLLALVFSFTACGGGNKKAFEASKSAYDKIDAAYQITETIGSDIYDAWLLTINREDDMVMNGIELLAEELELSEEEITEGVVSFFCHLANTPYDEAPEDTAASLRDSAPAIFYMFEEEIMDVAVQITVYAYQVNGKAQEAELALNEAKATMKELSENYSDYEHYPNLKEYFTTTSAFFDFTQNPTGSFEQLKDTINNYKNDARDYKNDLDYIFED